MRWAALGDMQCPEHPVDEGKSHGIVAIACTILAIAGLRVGLPVTTSLSAYAKGGYSNTRLSVEYQGSGTNLHSFVRPGALDGFYAGAGVELALTRRWLVRGEYRYANFHDGLYRHQGVVAVGLRF